MSKNHTFLVLRILFFSLISFLYFSCATTKIESIKKSEIDFDNYKKIIVFVDDENLKNRNLIEKKLTNKLKENLKNAKESVEIISPLKTWTDEEIEQIILKNDFDLLIKISILSTYLKTEGTSGFVMSNGFFIGGSESEMTINFDIILYDVNSKEIIAKGTAVSKDEDDDIEDCIESISTSLSKKIIEEFFTKKWK